MIYDEPMERLEEIVGHPADRTFNTLHDKGLEKRKELTDERYELAVLMGKLPKSPPRKGTKEYEEYSGVMEQIGVLKGKISKKHDELMEILKTEEKISREIQDNKT